MEYKITDFTVYLQTKEWTTILETWLHWRYIWDTKKLKGCLQKQWLHCQDTHYVTIYIISINTNLFTNLTLQVFFSIYKPTTPFVSEI